MTSVLAWVGVDSHGPASVYIATDSRFTRGSASDQWDYGRKTFSSARYPDIAGYWGDVTFPVVSLSQFFTALDTGSATTPDATAEQRFQALERALRVALDAVPDRQRRAFSIIHAGRNRVGMASEFEIRTLSWTPNSAWKRRRLKAPAHSAAVQFGGTGAAITQAHLARWNASSHGGTSRAVYSAFVDSLLEGTDPMSGGPPQLVGLYRIGVGRTIGTVVGRDRFLNGAPVWLSQPSDELQWRNELFEITSGVSRRRIPGAQRHVRPTGGPTAGDH